MEQLLGAGGANLPVPAAPPRPELPGLRKAAVFLAQMSKEEAGAILAQLRPREVEALTRELMRLGSVESEDVDGVMNELDRKSTRLNSSHANISYAVFCLKKKKINNY